MNELVNSKNGKQKDYAIFKASIKRSNRWCKNKFNKSESNRATKNWCKSARISAKENCCLTIRYDEFNFFKCASTNQINNEKIKKNRELFSTHSKKNRPLSILNTSISTDKDTHELFDKNMLIEHTLFKSINIKPKSKIFNDLKMRIKKCYKESKRIVANGVNGDATDNTDLVHKDDKNCAEKVVDKILKRKRQTCRTQFRHKDITLYKLGSDNGKGSAHKNKVMQKVFQRKTSPQKQHFDECCTSKMNTEESNLNKTWYTVDILDNNCNNTSLSKLDFKPKIPLRLTKQSAQLHIQDNVSTEKSEVLCVRFTKQRPSNHSIENLTSPSFGKHNLPIRIPEGRSSIAEPLHTPPACTKLKNGQNVSTTSFNFLTTNAVKDLFSKEETSSIQTPLENVGNNNNINNMRSSVIYDVAKQPNQFDSTIADPVKGVKNIVSRDFLKDTLVNKDSVSIESLDVQPKVYVSTATTSHNLIASNSNVNTTSLLRSSLDNKSLNKPYATKKFKRKKTYSLDEKDKQYNDNNYLTTSVPNFFSSIPLDLYNYSQNNLYLQSLLSYNQAQYVNNPSYTQSTIPTYIPYEHNSSILGPADFNYDYHNHLYFDKFNNYYKNTTANSNNETPLTETKKLNVVNTEETLNSDRCEKLPVTSKTESSIKLKVLRKEEHVNAEKESNANTIITNKTEDELVNLNLKVIENLSPRITNKIAPVNIEEHDIIEDTSKSVERISCSSPVIISDSDTEIEKPETIAPNLSGEKQNKLLDDKSNLTLASARNDNKLFNSTQSRVLETLNTLTYVVNEIIDKAGDNMLREDKELLHKLLEGVCQNSSLSTDKKPEYIVKQENCIDLISSDSELSNDAFVNIRTDSIDTLDLSMKKTSDIVKPPTAHVPLKYSNLEEKSAEVCQNDDNIVINLSIRNTKNQVNSFVSKEKHNAQESLSFKSATNYNTIGEPSSELASTKLSKGFSNLTDYNTQKQPRVFGENNAVVQNNAFDQLRPHNSLLSDTLSSDDNNKYLSSNLVPHRRVSCNSMTKPVEVIHKESTTDTSFYQRYGDNWFQNPSVPVRNNIINNAKEPKLHETEYSKSQFEARNNNGQFEHYDRSLRALAEMQPNKYYEKSVALSPKKLHYNSLHNTHARFLNSHANNCNDFALNVLKTNNGKDKSLIKGDRFRQQCNTSISDKKKVNKNIKELLKNKQKKIGKTTTMSYDATTTYLSHNKPNAAQAEHSIKFTKTSEASPSYRNQHNSHYNNDSKCLNFKQPVDTLSKKSFPIYPETNFNILLDNNEKGVIADLVQPASDLSFSANKKSFESDVHIFNNNLSPDYGYFSPLSKFTSVLENNSHIDVSKTNTLFNKHLDSLQSSVLNMPIEPNSKHLIPTCKKPHSSPLLHPKEHEKLLKILPKLHSHNTLTPEQYVLELHILEKYGCPRSILDFYSYITKKQIASNQKPVCFRIFLEFQNAGKLKDFESAFKIYSEKHENEKHVLKE